MVQEPPKRQSASGAAALSTMWLKRLIINHIAHSRNIDRLDETNDSVHIEVLRPYIDHIVWA